MEHVLLARMLVLGGLVVLGALAGLIGAGMWLGRRAARRVLGSRPLVALLDGAADRDRRRLRRQLIVREARWRHIC